MTPLHKKVIVLTIWLLWPAALLAQTKHCLPGRYNQTPTFANSQIVLQTGITYGIATNALGQPQTLMLNIAYPNPTADTLPARPLVILAHGGGFLIGNRTDFDTLCTELARRGYVAATISYRLGWYAGPTFSPESCAGSNLSLKQAIYRAVQDMHAATRYLVQNQNQYGIDTSQIFVGGGSAGGVMSLALGYLNQQAFDAFDPNLANTLGPISTAGNAHTNTFKLKGIINLWGGMLDTSYIEKPVPMLAFHGSADATVPYNIGPAFGCSNYLTVYGSLPIARRLKTLGGCYELNTQPGGGHGVYTQAYLFDHIICFLKRQLCNQCQQIEQTNAPALCHTPMATKTNTPTPKYTLYPNPAGPTLAIGGLGNRPQPFFIYNSVGEVVKKGTASPQTRVPTKGMANGLYFVRIGHQTLPLIIQK